MPLVTNGAPPAWDLLRPVSSHSKQIIAFCTWNGLLVLAGVRADATNDGHVFADSAKQTALWFGGIDDLWKFGKTVGRGGPWLESDVRASSPSDPYLMTGYESNMIELSHTSEEPVAFTLQVDIEGNGIWVDYETFKIDSGETLTHEFYKALSAFRIRALTDRETTASVVFN